MAILAFSLTDILIQSELWSVRWKSWDYLINKENHQSAKLDKASIQRRQSFSRSCAGTSNVTTYVESAAGIGAGGRTGWRQFCGDLFLLFQVSLVLCWRCTDPLLASPIWLLLGSWCWVAEKYPLGRYVRNSSCFLHLYLYGLQLLDYTRDPLLGLSPIAWWKWLKRTSQKEVHSMVGSRYSLYFKLRYGLELKHQGESAKKEWELSPIPFRQRITKTFIGE